VEVIRRTLAAKVEGRLIRGAEIRAPRLTRRAGSPATVAAGVTGRRIHALARRGKFLQFVLGETSLLVRLGMTGQLRWWPDEASCRQDGHTHAVFRFADGSVLTYRDARKFGEMFLLDTAAVEAALKIGPEPLEAGFTPAILRQVCRSAARVKSVLLDQRKIAGIGNIYADEALFRAKIRPTRRAASLSDAEVRALCAAIRAVLTAAIRQRGSSISDFLDPCGEPGGFAAQHRVYHRQGTVCRACGDRIRRILVGQRGTHFCPTCQR
jgi:formamidopyrimidine-DNA glycosylase